MPIRETCPPTIGSAFEQRPNRRRVEWTAVLTYRSWTAAGIRQGLTALEEIRLKRAIENMLKVTYVVFNMNLHDRLEEFWLRRLAHPRWRLSSCSA